MHKDSAELVVAVERLERAENLIRRRSERGRMKMNKLDRIVMLRASAAFLR